jgi:hypothetical protein
VIWRAPYPKDIKCYPFNKQLSPEISRVSGYVEKDHLAQFVAGV